MVVLELLGAIGELRTLELHTYNLFYIVMEVVLIAVSSMESLQVIRFVIHVRYNICMLSIFSVLRPGGVS